MPNYYAHTLAAVQTAKKINPGRVADALRAWPQVYQLGAQGADPFYYAAVLPWQPRPDLVAVGDDLHGRKTNAFLCAAATAIQSVQGEQAQVLTAYLAGYMGHYALDSTAHPYVLALTGPLGFEIPLDLQTVLRHTLLENQIDVLLIQRGALPDFTARRLFALTGQQSRWISAFYRQVIRQVYGREVAEERIRRAIGDFVAIHQLLAAPRHPVTRLAYALAPLIDDSGVLRASIYPDAVDPAHDPMNQRKAAWQQPWVDGAWVTDDFDSLFVRAVELHADCLACLEAAVQPGADVVAALAPVGNRSMTDGQDCDQRRPLRPYAIDGRRLASTSPSAGSGRRSAGA